MSHDHTGKETKAQLRALHSEALNICQRYVALLHKEEAKARHLRSMLRTYGRHHGYCIEQTKDSCSCQFTDVLMSEGN